MSTDEFLIVGLGASAGGIKAFKEFFEHVPADSGMAYVVVLHLSPEHDSHLAEVLQVSASIPVTQVRERVRIQPNHVYVVPPNQSLSMPDGHLGVSNVTRIEERRAPVDIFFRTLAESRHSYAACVVLSGTGADGSMGLKRVKELGGICLVQDPDEAEFSDMPRNSIATALVDHVLPVKAIPAKLIAYRNSLATLPIEIEEPDRPASMNSRCASCSASFEPGPGTTSPTTSGPPSFGGSIAGWEFTRFSISGPTRNTSASSPRKRRRC